MSLEHLNRMDHFVVVMLENRSFDHMLGFLYAESGGRGPREQAFEGLSGQESNSDSSGKAYTVTKLKPDDPFCYFSPRADPGEGFSNTSAQLYGDHMVVAQKVAPTNAGFVKNYVYTLDWEEKASAHRKVYEGASAGGIMAMHTPESLPVLSTLARQYAVCDQWFCSVPSETQCNRAFMHMATSEGLIKNNWKHQFTSKSIFGALSQGGQSWKIYAYDTKGMSMTRFDIADLESAPDENFGVFAEFESDAKAGKLANYTFLEPKWGSDGNSMHPNYNVANGEQWLAKIYEAVRSSPQWEKTMLIVTFDEHGGCYDHVAPPANAAQPDHHVASNGFRFDRFGVRVPCVLISPYIEAGTIHRTSSPTPFDHTSILRTVGLRFGLPPLTRRDAAAPHLADVLSLSKARSDNALAGVKPPSAKAPPVEHPPSALQQGLVEQAHRYPDPTEHGHRDRPPEFRSGGEAVRWAHERYHRYHEYYDRYKDDAKERRDFYYSYRGRFRD